MNCANCGTELNPVFPGLNRRKDDCQYENALIIDFTGGYGMFDDDIPNLTKQAILCHDCAHALIAANPWMRWFVDDERGHMHDGKSHHAREGKAVEEKTVPTPSEWADLMDTLDGNPPIK